MLETLIHEALTQVKSLEGNDSMDARQMARHIQEKMAGVTTKLEQVSTLVRVLNCDVSFFFRGRLMAVEWVCTESWAGHV